MDSGDYREVKFFDFLKLGEWVDAKFDFSNKSLDNSAFKHGELFFIYEGDLCVGIGYCN